MDKNLWGINPNLKDFLERKESITVIGLFWAGIWRWYLVVLAVAFGLGMLSGFLESF